MSEKRKSLNEFYETKVKDIMQTTESEIPCIEEKADDAIVFSILSKKDHVWVIDSKEPKHILGVITESDTIVLFSPPLTALQSFDKPDPRSLQYGVSVTAEEIMSKNLITTTPEETIKDIITKMKQHNVKQLAVVDQNDILLGEITLHHLIDTYIKAYTNK